MPLYSEASPLNTSELETIGWKIRELLGLTRTKWLPVPHIVEHMLPHLFGEDYSFRVEEKVVMGSNHGYADLEQKELVLRSDVYDGMVAGRGRDRMTAIHEMSHLIIHPGKRLFRRMMDERPKPWRDPEWQAKCLAGTVMMPKPLLEGYLSGSQVAEDFGVSEEAATYRLGQIRRPRAQ